MYFMFLFPGNRSGRQTDLRISGSKTMDIFFHNKGFQNTTCVILYVFNFVAVVMHIYDV
jgi:hypothetical protein